MLHIGVRKIWRIDVTVTNASPKALQTLIHPFVMAIQKQGAGGKKFLTHRGFCALTRSHGESNTCSSKLRPVREVFEEFQAIFDLFPSDVGKAVGGKRLAGERGRDRAVNHGLADVIEGE
jgi:hypothetical protein